jgi:hypothetical protein
MISKVTIVKKMCDTPSTFHNGQVGAQIRHLLNHAINVVRVATQAISESPVNVTDPCATFLAEMAQRGRGVGAAEPISASSENSRHVPLSEVLALGGLPPFRARVEQVHEEVVGQ